MDRHYLDDAREHGHGISWAKAAALTAALTALAASAAGQASAQTNAPAAAAAAAAAAAPSPANALVADGGIAISRSRVRTGDTVFVTLLLRHQGTGIVRSQGPSTATVYSQNERYADRGTGVMRPDGYGVAMTLSGPRGEEWPYRWSLGGDMKPGETRRVTLPLRLTEPGVYTLYVGVAAGNRVREFALGQIGVEVAAPGKPFKTRAGLIGTPPPRRLVVNGKEVSMDQNPLYYDPTLQNLRTNLNLLAPIRFIAETMGAQVRWDGGRGNVHIRRGGNDIMLRIGSKTHVVNGRPVASNAPPRIINGRTMVPIYFLTEQLGGDFDFNERTHTLSLTLPDLVPSRVADRVP